jgi:hypothetical protein
MNVSRKWLGLLMLASTVAHAQWATQDGVSVYTNQANWEAAIAAYPGLQIDSLPTTSTNVALANEVASPPADNADLGKYLTFDKANTGFNVSFQMYPSQSSAKFTFNDTEGTGSAWQDALSVGDINNYENDNFYINVLSNDQVFAMAVEIRENTFVSGENFIISSGGTQLADFNANSLPDDDIVFIGILSSTPFDQFWFDEDSGGDDIAIANPQFVYADPAGDADNDGLTWVDELSIGSDPWNADTDNDGILDGDEVANGLDPTQQAFTGAEEVQKLLASNGAAFDRFGYSLSVDGDTALVGAYGNDDGGSNSGSAYLFVRNGTNWVQQAKLTASDAAAGDEFGRSVSLNGDTAVIGAPKDDDAASNSGSAYVFVRNGTNWTQQAKLTAADAASDDTFGSSVSLNENTAVIGAYKDDTSASDTGSAYVFVREGSNWTQQAKLTAADAAYSDWFGYSVSVDGDTAVVGSYLDDDAGTSSGSAYIFVRDGTSWTQQAKLTASDAANSDRFGYSVSLWGETALIGAFADDHADADAGSAYIFVRNGTSWTEQAKLTASDAAWNDQFGASVSLNGNTAVIGAPEDDDGGESSGSAYVFVNNGTNWIQRAKLTASDGALIDKFGYSVDLDGDTALVGAIFDDDGGDSSGSAYFFDLYADSDGDGLSDSDEIYTHGIDPLSSDTDGDGILDPDELDNGLNPTQPSFVGADEIQKLLASDTTSGENFGVSVSMDGNTAVIGAHLDAEGGSGSGSAYVFVREGTNWIEQAKLTASDAATDDNFGRSVSVDGDTALIGAYHDDDGGSDSGSAYVFVRNGTNWTQQAKLTASDVAASDWFGQSVSLSDDTALVGAHRDDDAGANSGSAYVFVRSGTNWTQQAKLTASDATAVDWFGIAVSLSDDTALIGAHLDDDAGSDSGSAYVFLRNGTNWLQQAKLTAADATAGDQFGRSVSIDGDTVLIGAHLDEDGGFQSGSAYVFMRNGTNWTQQAKLTAADAAIGDRFGSSVDLDGDTALVSAHLDDDVGGNSGSAYVFVRNGTNWVEQVKLTASDGAASDIFGISGSIDGDTVLIGASQDDDGGTDSGSVYLFDLYADSDGDGVTDYDEIYNLGTDPLVPNATNPDTDGDGIPNVWEDLYGLDSSVSNETADVDGDGFSNWEEYVWDTVPTNGNSFFRIGITGTGIDFPSSSNRYYTLQFRESLTEGAWSNVPERIVVPGNGITNAMDHARTTTNGFYRVNVQVDP